MVTGGSNEISLWGAKGLPIFRDELLVFGEGKLQESWKSVDVCWFNFLLRCFNVYFGQDSEKLNHQLLATVVSIQVNYGQEKDVQYINHTIEKKQAIFE